MKFVLHSYDKLDWRSRSRGFRARSDTHAQQAPRLHDLRFSIGTKFVFSLYDTRKKFRTITRISLGMKTGMNSFRNGLGTGTKFRLGIKKYDREKYIEME